MHRIPQKLIKIICDLLVSEYLPEKKRRQKRGSAFNDRDVEFFSRGAETLAESFASGGGDLPKNYLNKPEYRAGYLLYFTVTNYLKARFCLERLCHPGLRAGISDAHGIPACAGMTKRPLSILDLGSGPGTAVLAAADVFGTKGLSATCIDQNPHILNDAEALAKDYSGLKINKISAVVTSKNIGRFLGEKKFDVIFMMNFLDEIHDRSERERILETLFTDHLEQTGVIIVVEPAFQRQTRDLMGLRDAAAGLGNILSPCLHNDPCPMLTHSRKDWCHFYLDWERPRLIEKTDDLLGNRQSYINFSYFILSREAAKQPTTNVWRVVSSPLVSKEKIELLVCNQTGLVRLTRLSKDRSQTNWRFEELKRGDILVYDGPEKIGKDAVISPSNLKP